MFHIHHIFRNPRPNQFFPNSSVESVECGGMSKDNAKDIVKHRHKQTSGWVLMPEPMLFQISHFQNCFSSHHPGCGQYVKHSMHHRNYIKRSLCYNSLFINATFLEDQTQIQEELPREIVYSSLTFEIGIRIKDNKMD